MKEILPAVIAFSGGALAEFVNYLITRSALGKKSGVYMILPLRTLVAGGCLAAIYFIGRALKLDLTVFMIAGALGATAGLIVFTLLLIRGTGKESSDG
ncbi:MAG: hypothetical protein J5854_08195 [Clostridia bacterium]|nr:hypothetical protein [Clostridia bacterium]